MWPRGKGKTRTVIHLGTLCLVLRSAWKKSGGGNKEASEFAGAGFGEDDDFDVAVEGDDRESPREKQIPHFVRNDIDALLSYFARDDAGALLSALHFVWNGRLTDRLAGGLRAPGSRFRAAGRMMRAFFSC